MKAEEVIRSLQENDFNRLKLDSVIMNQLEQQNIDVWASDTKLVMLKEYRTKISLMNWEIEDNIHISSALHNIPKKYFNNFYFFMVLDFNSNEIDVRLELNKIEKNDLICKKYILKSESDLNRVPFLMETTKQTEKFAFDKKFQVEILKFKHESEIQQALNLELMLEDYLTNYLKDKDSSKVKVKNILAAGGG